MARKVKEMPVSHRASRYPWDEWMDGNIWELSPGKDFECSLPSMRQQVYQAAANAELSATTREHEGKLYIQVTERN